jgi:signal transduction histidine kinase/AraC-like DNA-binding protein
MQQPILILIFLFLYSSTLCQDNHKIDSLQGVIKTTHIDSVKINAYIGIGDELMYAEPDKALEYGKKALLAASLNKNAKSLVDALYNLGYLYRMRSENTSALDHYKKALVLCETHKLELLRSHVLVGLSNTFWRMTLLDSAKYYCHLNLQWALKTKNKLAQADGYSILGNILLDENAIDEALNYFIKAAKLFEQENQTQDLASTYINIGVAEFKMGNYEKALTYYKQSHAIFENSTDAYNLAFVEKSMAMAYRKNGEPDKAIALFNKALQFFLKSGDKLELGRLSLSIGNLYYDKKDFSQAMNKYKEGRKYLEAVNDTFGLMNIYKGAGMCYKQLGNADQALQYLNLSVALAKKNKDYPSAITSLAEIAEVYNSLGQHHNAYQNQLVLISLKDSLFHSKSRKTAEELEAKYQNEKKSQNILTLSKENEIKSLQVQQGNTERRYLIAFSLLSILLIGVVLNRYKIKTTTNRKLKELDRIKSRFFANISHEFRTPLTLIIGPLENKIFTSVNDQEKVEFMQMHRNAKKLHMLINQLLDLSKIEAGGMKLQLVESDISQFLKLTLSLFSSLAEQKKIQYTLDTLEEPVTGCFDPDKLERIITNILYNAFKFTAAGGEITVTVRNLNGNISIIVKDTGIGIPVEKQKLIFERFYQIDDSSTRLNQGTGIGLALSKELAEIHHGKITLTSVEGEGSEFVVSIPIDRKAYKNYSIQTSAPGINHYPKYLTTNVEGIYPQKEEEQNDLPLVLIAEDNIEMREFIAKTLSSNYRIIEASNGEEAFEKALATVPDLVVSDLMMPIMDGNELCKKLKTNEATSHIPVILLTAKASLDSKLEGLQTGADDYLTKPFDTLELTTRIHNLIEQRKKLRERYRQEITLQPKNLEITPIDVVFLNKILAIIETNCADADFGVEELTKEIGMSRMQFHRKIKALTDQSAGDFLRQFRLERAKQLLRVPGTHVSDVAYQVGFNNLSHFTKAFKDFTGSTPSDFITSKEILT